MTANTGKDSVARWRSFLNGTHCVKITEPGASSMYDGDTSLFDLLNTIGKCVWHTIVGKM